MMSLPPLSAAWPLAEPPFVTGEPLVSCATHFVSRTVVPWWFLRSGFEQPSGYVIPDGGTADFFNYRKDILLPGLRPVVTVREANLSEGTQVFTFFVTSIRKKC